jgi:transcriptional regulator with XRE-family HTH domain
MRRSRGIPAEELAGALTSLRAEVTRTINSYLGTRGLTQSELAEQMGVTPGRVSQILAGDENLTLRTLATVAAALGARFEVALQRDEPQADVPIRPAEKVNKQPQPAADVAGAGRQLEYASVASDFPPELYVAESRYVESLQVGAM